MSASTDTRKKDRLPVPPPKAAKQQPESKAQRMAKVVATVTPKSDPGTQSTATPQATSAILGPTAEKPEAQVTPAPEAGKAAVDGPDLTSVTLGQATAPAQSIEDDIPPFLAREPDQPLAKLIHAKKKASTAATKKATPAAAPTKAPLTDHDKQAIAELKKAGADKVSAIKQVGAKLKSEKENAVKKAKTTNGKAKTAKPAKAKGQPKAKKTAPSGMVVDILKLASRKNGVTPAELNELTKWKGAPWRWLYTNPKGTGYCDRWGYKFDSWKDDEGTHYHVTKT